MASVDSRRGKAAVAEAAPVLFATYLRAKIRSEKSTVGRLRSLVQAVFDFARQEPASYAQVMSSPNTQLPGLPQEVFVEVIAEGMEKGIFQRHDETLAAAMVVGAVARVISFQERGLIDRDNRVVVPLVTDACIRLLAPEDIWAADCC